MLKVLIKFWPVLVPFIIFVYWFFKHKKKHAGSNLNKKVRDERVKAFTIATISSFFIALIMIVVGMFTLEKNKGEKYIPAKLQDGVIIPPHKE
jgi:hypothetical protein